MSLTPWLSILPIDERYGPEGHKDSNYTQFMAASPNLKKAKFPTKEREQLTLEHLIKFNGGII